MNKPQVDVPNAEVVLRGNYAQELQAIYAAGFCPFCEEHLMKHHPKPLLFRSRHWLVTENGWPYEGAVRQFLLIARCHVEQTENLSRDAWTDLHAQYARLVHQYALPGATLWIRSGATEYTGASVNHLHAHVICGGSRTESGEPLKALVGFKASSRP